MSTLEQAKQISPEHCHVIEQFQEHFSKFGHYEPVMEGVYQMFKERLLQEHTNECAARRYE